MTTHEPAATGSPSNERTTDESDFQVLSSMPTSVHRRIARVLSKSARDKAMTACVVKLNRLVAREEQRTRSRMLAYRVVARELNRSAGWIRALIGQGVGRIDQHISERIDEMLIRGLEADVARLTHDLELARRSGAHPASDRITEVEKLLAQAGALLNGEE